jgi:hypothetical protein
MLTRRILLSALLLAAVPAFAAPKPKSATERDPAAIVAEIYRPTRDDEVGAAFGIKPAERRKYLSRELIGLWAKADRKDNPTGKEVGPIDWDVTTNSQGMEVGSYTLKIALQDATHMNLVATLVPKTPWTRKSPDENVVRYHFIRENGRWVIDDIRGADDAQAQGLKGLLRQALER